MMTLEELYSALEEADRRAQAGDEEAKQDAIELASMIEQFKESTTPTQETDEVSPIIVGTATGIAAGAKGVSEVLPTAGNIARANKLINAPATSAIPDTPAATTPHGFHPGATSNAQFNAEQIEANKLLKPGNVPPGYKVEGNSRLIVPTTVDTQAKGTSPVIAPKQEARQIALDKLKRGTTASGQFASRVPGINVLGGGMAGYQGADAYNRAQRGDVPGAVVSGIGSTGSAASTLLGKKHPIARIGGLGVGLLAPVVNRAIDAQSTKEEKAMGGPVGYAKGKAVKGGLEAAKKLFDPRFDKRVLEQEKLANQVLHTERTGPKDIPRVYLPDYEGYPVITSMSDRSAAGTRLKGINNVMFNQPVDLPGGQEFMYGNMAWASGIQPVNQIMEEAVQLKKKTGKDPLYAPWRMAPTGSDFAHMTGETMLAYAQSAMGKSEKKDLDNLVKKFIPDWAGIDDPRSMQQFVYAPSKVRKSVQKAMDRDLRDAGSLGLGEARLAIADPAQINAPEGGLMHIAKIHADKPIIEASGHPSYPKGVPGEGLGRIEGDFMATQILPQMVKERGIKDVLNPSAQDIRALQMKPYSTIMDDKLLKALGFAEGGEVQGYNAGNVVKKAVQSGLGFVKPAAKSHSQDPRVARALEAYLKGDISQEERIRIMNEILPARKWNELPPDYTDEQIRNALTSDKQPKALAPVPAGMQVGNRLDIPAYTDHGVYIDTTHDIANKNKPISYGRTGHLKGVEFSSSPDTFVRVGLGTQSQALTPMGAEIGLAKTPKALIKGTNQGTSDQEVRRMMAEMMQDPNYTQIGMDPRRHSQFYDKSTGMPVWAAEEKLQSGPLILVPKRGLEATDWNDPRLNLSKFEGKKYAEGGSTSPAWQRAEGKNPEGGLNAVGRASYNRETGGNLKAPQPEGGPRKKSFCARMSGMKKKLTSSETANDPDSRINKSLRKWKC